MLKYHNVKPFYGSPAASTEDAHSIRGLLERFWTTVCRNEVKCTTSETNGLQTLTLGVEGRARWGATEASPVSIVVRREYQRVCGLLDTCADLKVAIVRGTKGIGKSVFAYWLIYQLVQRVVGQFSSDTGETSPPTGNRGSRATSPLLLPTFGLLLGAGGTRKYFFLGFWDGRPAVSQCDAPPSCDYFLSDVFDTSAAPRFYKLHICSDVANDCIKYFDHLDNTASSTSMVMGTCQIEELHEMFPDDPTRVELAHLLLGGSARLVRILLGRPDATVTGSNRLVTDALSEFLDGTEYATDASLRPLLVWAARMIAFRIDTHEAQAGTGAQASLHTLFQHMTVTPAGTKEEPELYEVNSTWASPFMGHLGRRIFCDRNPDVLPYLKDALKYTRLAT